MTTSTFGLVSEQICCLTKEEDNNWHGFSNLQQSMVKSSSASGRVPTGDILPRLSLENFSEAGLKQAAGWEEEEEMENNMYSLGMDFTVDPHQEEAVSVDLEGEWGEDTMISRHPGFEEPNLEYISGEVGPGGDHLNLTFKNISDQPVTIEGNTIVIQLHPRDPVDCPELVLQHPRDDLPLMVQMSDQETVKNTDSQDGDRRTSGEANEANQKMQTKAVDTTGCESEIDGTGVTGESNVYVYKTYT